MKICPEKCCQIRRYYNSSVVDDETKELSMIRNGRVIYGTVIYGCQNFDLFMSDYLGSVFNQTYVEFDLLLVLDGVSESEVQRYLIKYNKMGKKVYINGYDYGLSPAELRIKLIELSYEMNAGVLIFSDFDEIVSANRVEEVVKNIYEYDFAFNDFYVTDEGLNKVFEESFFSKRNVPCVLDRWREIESFNFVGLGSLSVNLKSFDYMSIQVPRTVVAFDWFLITSVLLNNGKGIKIDRAYAYYRQHKKSLVGFDFSLNEERLWQGINVKLEHYKGLSDVFDEFKKKYDDVVGLIEYIHDIGSEDYIGCINNGYDVGKFCWWENIKMRSEVR